MWSKNALTERLNLEWPILQAPMGGKTTPALAAAVSNVGGLGSLGMWGFAAEDVERRIAGFRQQSGGGLNVNYPLWDDPGDCTGKGQDDAHEAASTERRARPRAAARGQRVSRGR